MPPMPSEPANIPITKNNIRVGTPNLAVVLPPIMLSNNSTEPTNKIFPGDTFISFHSFTEVKIYTGCLSEASFLLSLLLIFINSHTTATIAPININIVVICGGMIHIFFMNNNLLCMMHMARWINYLSINKSVKKLPETVEGKYVE